MASSVIDKPNNTGGLFSLVSADSQGINKIGIYVPNNNAASPTIKGSSGGTEWDYKLISNHSFGMYTFEKTNVSVPANGEVSVEFDIARSGYTFLGCVGYTSSNSYAIITRLQSIYSENKVNITLRNILPNQVNTIVRAQALYV